MDLGLYTPNLVPTDLGRPFLMPYYYYLPYALSSTPKPQSFIGMSFIFYRKDDDRSLIIMMCLHANLGNGQTLTCLSHKRNAGLPLLKKLKAENTHKVIMKGLPKEIEGKWEEENRRAEKKGEQRLL